MRNELEYAESPPAETGIPVSLHDVGPITDFEFTMHEPGLYVVSGDQGAGKTTILRTVQFATTGHKPEGMAGKRDGVRKSGLANVGGREVRFASRVTNEGEVGLDGMGDVHIDTIHTPNVKYPHKRDEWRIRTLALMAGAVGGLAPFRSILDQLPEELRDVKDCPDIVEQAAAVKAAVDRHAKALETIAERGTSQAALLAEQVLAKMDGLPADANRPESELDAWLSDAMIFEATLNETARTGKVCRESAERAREMQRQAAKEYAGPTVEAAASESSEAKRALDDATRAVLELQKQLMDAEHAQVMAVERSTAARNVLQHAEEHAAAMARWREQAEAVAVTEPTVDELAEAANRVTAARLAVQQGAHARDAVALNRQAVQMAEEVKATARKARDARRLAKETFQVVANVVESLPGSPLRIEYDDKDQPRLVTDHERGPNTYLDELSDGEKWGKILPMCCQAGRLVVLSQAGYGELTDETRGLIDAAANDAEAYVLTAVAVEGPLRAARFVIGPG